MRTGGVACADADVASCCCTGCSEGGVVSSCLRLFLLGEMSLFVAFVVADDDECLVLLASGWSLLSVSYTHLTLPTTERV